MPRILTRASGLGAAVLALFAASGCGSGGNTTIIHTTGSFSKASLNGTYVYEIHAFPFSGVYREVGAFTADGAGNITAGSDDSTLNSGGAPVAFTGSYQVGSDGTGFITFNNTALGAITFAITLESSSRVKLMEADFFANAVGTAELQTSTATPNGTFVFRLHEEAAAQSSGVAASEVGAFTVSGGSVANGGAMDINLGGTSSQPIITGGTFNAPGTLGRGTATVTDSSPFSTNFIYYVVSAGKFVILVSNANAVGSGTAEAQSSAVGAGLSGNYAFGSAGDDGVSFAGTATVGSFTASGGAINPYTFDSQQDFTYSNGTDQGQFTKTANGRVAVTLNSNPSEVFWMVSPARAFFLINSASKVEDGTADLQTVNSFSASTMNGQFAMLLGGVDLSFSPGQDLSRIGPMNFNGSGKLTVAELANGSFSGVGAQPPAGGGLTGSYQVDSSTGRISATVSNSSVAPLDLVMYAVSGSEAYAMQVDSDVVTSGTVSLQH